VLKIENNRGQELGTEEDEEVVEEVVHRHPHHSLVPSRDVDDELIL
jgi:16S rRNA C967 or C1407 C5-methylase (RsmB/RsmF family)